MCCENTPKKRLIICLILATFLTCSINLIPLKVTVDNFDNCYISDGDLREKCYSNQDDADRQFILSHIDAEKQFRPAKEEEIELKGNDTLPERSLLQRRFAIAVLFTCFFGLIMIALTALAIRFIIRNYGRLLYLIVILYIFFFIVAAIVAIMYSYHMTFKHEDALSLSAWKTIIIVTVLQFYILAVTSIIWRQTKKLVEYWSKRNTQIKFDLKTDEYAYYSKSKGNSPGQSNNSLQRLKHL